MEKIILTNKKWFKQYLVLRRIIIAIMFSSFFLIFIQESISLPVRNVIQTVSTALLMTLLLFDYIQKPFLLEVKQSKKGLKIGVYKPNLKYAIVNSKRKTKYFSVGLEDKVSIKVKLYRISLFNQITIKVEKNCQKIYFLKMNFSWASQKDIELIKSKFDEHNKNNEWY